jgi:hypothetical protein
MKASLAMVAASLMFTTTAIAGEHGGTMGLLSPNTLGALVASPFLTEDGETRITVTTITNTSGVKPINLHMIFLASGADWREINRDCVLTPRETTYVIMHTTGGSTFADYECSSPNLNCTEATCNNQITTNLLTPNGTLFVAPECAPGPYDQECLLEQKEFRTINEDLLRSDFTVIDFAGGYAFSAPALHIQAAHPNNDYRYGDRWYKFNGRRGEYKQFPSMLTGSYIATDDNLTAEVILMNLDGTPSDGAPAKAAGDIYDDDEDSASGNFEFDCMEVLPLQNAWLNFPDSSNGHVVGHFEIGSIAVPYPGVHDVISSNGDSPNVRVAAIHGYILQTSSSDFPNEGNPGMNGTGAWARQLTQSTNMLPRAPGDIPSLYGMGSVAPREKPCGGAGSECPIP